MNDQRYISADRYHAVVEALIEARPSLIQPDLKSIIIEILGEIGGIWPACCRDELERPVYQRANFA